MTVNIFALIDSIQTSTAFVSQLDETGYDAIDEKNKRFVDGDLNFILKEVNDKMGHPGIAGTVEFIQRHYDVPCRKQKVLFWTTSRNALSV